MKLINADDFSSVFNYRKRLSSSHLYIHYCPNNFRYYRLGFVVAKKIEKLAVKRNYMRRSLREVIKQHFPKIVAFDIVVRVHNSFYKDAFHEIENEIKLLLLNIK